jgi:4a-hydroxytetrahydrobiopterin dehydratase
MLQRLNGTEIDAKLKQLDSWILDAHKASVRKEWEFDSFQTAMRFFAQVGELAEVLNHHPEFVSNYTRMRIRLTTHDAYGLTHKDFELAHHIDYLVREAFSGHLK